MDDLDDLDGVDRRPDGLDDVDRRPDAIDAMDRRPDNLDDMDRHMDRRIDGMDRRLLSALHACGMDPRVGAVARALSWSGEHGALWLVAGLAGAAVDRERRGAWARATALTTTAHLASMGVKWIVRRPRPAHVVPLVRTAGRHSFPSSHATSAAAAAVAYGALRAHAVPPLATAMCVAVTPLAAAMCVSRMVVGVHYPSDVAAGAALGALTARLGARWIGVGHG